MGTNTLQIVCFLSSVYHLGTGKNNRETCLQILAVEREIELEGVSRFHCQINRVFLTRASERFYSGLERLFQRLYRHLSLSQSSDVIITVCVESWLKMCTLVGKDL